MLKYSFIILSLIYIRVETFRTYFRKFFLWLSLGVLCLAILSANPYLTVSAQTNLEKDNPNLNIDYEYEKRNAKIEYQLQRNLKTPSTDEIPILIDLNGEYDQFSSTLEQLGFRMHRTYGNLVQGQTSADNIEHIADLPFVIFVREPVRPVYHDTVSEGVNILQADIAHSIEQTGKGAKVAIIDGGFDISNSEISANIVEARSFRQDGSIRGDNPRHGTACAEIVVDMAPDVELYLFTIKYSLDFIDAVNYAISQDVDIISISLGFHNAGPYDGTSRVSQVLDDARNAGVLPVVAVGNDAQRHWSGGFQDTDSDDWLNFAESDQTNSFTLHKGEEVEIFLSWNDWYRSDQDYDLFLFREFNNSLIEVDVSSTTQSGFSFPTESITYTANISGTYHISIYNSDASGETEFDLFVLDGGSLEYKVPSGSISNAADSKGAVAVGALNWKDNTLERFSSRGPTADGRIKPDIAAPDGVQTTAYSTPFFGTSASTPHIAGLAALLVGSSPSITADEMADVLENTAVDMGEAGKDNLYGSGRAETKYSTLDVSPRIVSLIVDGKEFSSSLLPRKFLVDGKPHPVSLSDTSVEETDTRYTFKQWSNGNTSPSLDILFDGGWQTRFAQFSLQYLLSIKTHYGTPSGDIWHDSGSEASFSIPSIVDQGNGTRRMFISWTGATTTTTPSTTVVMDSPKVVTALWKKQYELEILSSNLATTGQGWYDDGTIAIFSAESEIDYGNNTRRAFKYWSGDFSGNSTLGSVLMNAPKKIEADWKVQYFLNVVSSYGNPQGEGWHDRGEPTIIQVSALEDHANMTRHIFTGWTGDIVAAGNRLEVIVSEPKQVEANWKTQYYLEVDSAFGQPDGEGWYDRGASASFKVLTPVDRGNGTRHAFVEWMGDVEADTPEGFLLMSSPRKVSASWKTQYLVSLIFTDSSGQEEIDPSSVELIDKAGRRILIKDYEVWFDTDSYSIGEILWMNVDVNDLEASTFTVSRPGEIRFSTEIYSLTIIVRDVLSMPIQDAKVTTRFANGTSTEDRTDDDGIVRYSLIPLGGYSADVEVLGFRSQQIGEASLRPEVTVIMLLSIPTLTLFFAVAVGSALSAVLLVRRRSGGQLISVSDRPV